MSQPLPVRWRPVVEEIEPRILYSADFSPALLDTAPAVPAVEHRIVDATGEFIAHVAPEQQARSHEVVFVDTATPDYQKLVDDIEAQSGTDRQFDVVLLEPGSDGIQQISATLATMKDVSAVHLIGHGADGQVELGAATLNFESLLKNASQIQGWGQALTPGADLLIYGCDVAENADGRALIDALGRLTGANVAASEDLTGAAAKGGDWNLEYATGSIQTSVALSRHEQASWGWLLDIDSKISSVAAATDPAPAPTTQPDSLPAQSSAQDSPSAQQAATAASAQVSVASLPLAFEENMGQADAQVDFVARGSGYAVGLTGGDALIALQDGTSSQVVRLDVVGKNANTTAAGDSLLESKTNYLLGSQDQWHTGIDNYGAVRYDNVYDGIDLRYYGNQRQLEYDFIVNAGADVNAIRLNFEGVQSLSIAGNGDLLLTLDSAGKSISFKAPVAYQDGPHGRQAVSSHYSIGADGTVGFEIGAYDTSRQLVIDPVLSYGTYFGGTGNELANGIAVDAAGNVYLTGYTQSTGLLGLLGLGGGAEVFVAKFSPNLGSLIYSSYVGGAKDDIGTSVALDASGDAYVTGYTLSTDFPTSSPFQSNRSGNEDAFVFKLNAAGSALTYSTYLGGNGNADEGWAIAVDASGSAYVTGVASSSSFPTTAGAADTTYAGGDAFVTKLTPGGNALVYSTYIGGSAAETGFGIAVDPLGNAVVVGDTSSANFPTTANAYQATYAGGTDVFVTRLNSAGTAFTYSSYLGGSGSDIAYNVTLDNAGKIYLTGETASPNFALTGNALKTTQSGNTDAFVSVIDPGASGAASLVYSTYLGGSKNQEAGLGIGVDAGGRVYVAGQTDSSDFSVTAGAYQTTSPNKANAFLVVINPLASASNGLIYGTYFGGDQDDNADNGVFSNGKFYVAGDTRSSSGIATAGGSDTSYGGSGNTDAFVGIFSIAPTATATSGALPYVENAGLRILDAGFTASDPGVANLAGATIQITGNYVNGEDLLAFTSTNPWGITGTWNAASGTLALVGSSSVASYQAAVRSVTYQNTSENPSTAARSVTIVVSDGVLSSAPATRQITVTSVNDPPVNTAPPGTQGTSEDTALVFSLANGNQIAIGDVDAGTGAVQVSLTVTGGNLTLAQTAGLTFVTGTGTGNTAMTFTGELSSVNAALNGLRFDPAADFNGSASVQIVTNDQGNTGSGGALPAMTTVVIDVVAVNDAPVTSVPGPQSTPQNIDLIFSSTKGNAITISDVDAGTGILTVTLTPVNGTLTPGPMGGLASVAIDGSGNFILSGTLAALNTALDGLVFHPTTGFSGSASLQIDTNDQGNTGTGGTGVSTSAVAIVVSSDIAPIVTTSVSGLFYTENAPAKVVDPGLTVTDPDSSQLQHAVVRIAANYVIGEDKLNFTNQAGIIGSWDAASGTLILNGAASAAAYQTALRSITYQNLSDDPSTAARSVWFVVNDGIADGAIASSAIAIVAVNDAPVNTAPAAQSVDEDTGLLFSAANGNAISIADADASNSLIQVVLTAVNGTLSLAQTTGLTIGAGGDGTGTMTLDGSIDDINAALNGLRFDPVPDYNGAASVQIATSDLGNSGSGGAQLATASVGVTVVPVNDAPQGTGHIVSTLEDTVYTFAAVDFGFGDAQDNPSNQFLAVQITTLPGAGSLFDSGIAVAAGQFISVTDIAGDKLQFVPWANGNGAGYASFTFQVQDDGGTASGGVNLDPTPRTMTIDVAAVNDSPQIAPPSAQTTNEGTALVFSTANGNAWAIDDVDAGGNPMQVTLSVTHGTLALGGTAGLTFSTGSGSGDVSITFSGTLADLDAALDGLTYTPTAYYNGSAALIVGVDDLGNSGSGGPLSILLSQAITITPANSAPSGADKTVTVLEDGTYTFAVSDFGFSDAHDTPSNNLLAVQIVAPPGAGTLTNNGVAVTAGEFVTVADISAGKLRFTPAADGNGAAYASFTFQVQDDGGITNGGIDLDQTPNTLTVNVTAVNDAPAGISNTVSTLEDSAYTFAASDFGFSDIADAPANALAAVKITTQPGAGSLTDNGAALSAGQFVSLADIAAGNLKFTPGANANGAGYASFTFQVQDDGGTSNGGVDLDQSANTMSIDVTAVNDAPAGTNNTVSTLEDTAYTFAAADFGFSDTAESPANALAAVKITTLAGAGSLTDDGVLVNAGDFVSAADIAGGKLVFAPLANANGAGYASFTFQVQDDGGITNGGSDLDQTPNTLTVNVTAVNDAPAGTSNTVSTLEGTAYTFAATDFGFSDTADTPANALTAVKITTLPGAGSLTDNGVLVNAGDFITAADIASGKLVFTPVANANGGGYASFTFQVQDDGGIANGGVDLAPSANTMSIDVTAVNDAPAGTDNTVTTLEDTAYTFATADFGFSDTADSPANALSEVKITTLPGAGSLTDNGAAVSAGQFVSLADIAAGNLKFTPGANANGAGYASFSFQVQDDGGSANGGVDLDQSANTMSIDVTALNDAPAGTDHAVNTLEDTAYTFAAADFGFSDAFDAPANALTAVKVTTLSGAGSLTNNGVLVNAGDFISAGDIAGGKLVFTPVANAQAAGYASFTFQVQDDGGTANGAVNLDQSANTMSIDVTAVNDAPAGTSNMVGTLEDTAYTFGTVDFGFSDTADSPTNALTAVKITTLLGAGSLTNNGVLVNAGDFISAVDIAGGKLVFTPLANANGAGYASFTFQVRDDGGVANGAVDLDQSANTMVIDVTALNDAPAGSSNTVSTLEDTAYTFAAADFGLSDTADTPANALSAVKLTTLPGTGSLTNDGVLVNTGDFIAAADIVAGKLVFTPVANANGVGYASFTFQVQDDGGTANGGVDLDQSANTMSIDVTAVNDAPAGTDNTVTTLEDTAYTFAGADFGFSDAADAPANALSAVKITTLPGAGSLTDNGVLVNAGDFVTAADIAGGKLVFTPVANANGTGYASFSFQVQDDGGTSNSGVDLDPSAKTMSIDVTAVNDAPAGTDNTVATLEDTPYTFASADFGFSDAADTPANALAAVRITTLSGAGSLTNNGVLVNAGDFVTGADIAGGKLKFTPVADANGAGYASFTFQVQDDGGSANGGVDLDQSANTMSIDVSAVNDAPAGTSNTVSTLEDTAYTFGVVDFGFSDAADSPANALSEVKITTLPGAGSLTDNGTALSTGQFVSLADIAAGNLKFTSGANTSGAGYASFTFQVQDDGGTSNGGVDLDQSPNTMSIDVSAVNDAPAGTSNTVATLEDSAYAFAAADFGFSDAADTPANALSAVKITTLPGAGTLTDNGVLVNAGDFVSAADIAAGKLVFAPVANANGAGYASFTFQVQDDGGTANGGVDTDSTARTMSVNVTAVNDAPSGANNSVTTLEDAAYTFASADFGFNDATDSPANALSAVRIVTLSGAGSLTDNGVLVNAGDFVSAADIAGGKLVFTPAANASGAGYASFTFQVQDDGGTSNSGVDLDQSANTISIDVTAVNHAPAGTDHTLSTLEDTAYTFAAADFGFSDAADAAANALSAVKITTMPGAGSLTNNGATVMSGQFVSLADIAAGNLKFTPGANANGAGYASFSFQVQDDGGTANGGVDLDPSANTMNIDVTAVNDAPAGTDNTVITLEDTAYTFAAADFGFSDAADSPVNALTAVKIAALPGAGSLTNDGVLVNAGDFVTAADIAGGKLVFTPVANASGAGYANFTFQVQDDGGTANGGVDLDPSANTMRIDVSAVNDAPAGTNNTVTTLEDTAYTFGTLDFGFSDGADSPADALTAVRITTLPGVGSLTNNGVLVNAGDFVTAADIAVGKLVFTPVANANGAGYASFTFQVQDDSGTSNGGVDLDPSANTMSIDVSAVNDAPAGTGNTVTTLEGTAYTFASSDFGFSDAADSPANALAAVKITTLAGAGSLTNNGVLVNAADFISAADIASGQLVFTPAANGNGTGYASFTFQVQDDGGAASGGVDLDQSANTISINVTSVNDAPAGTDNTVITPEDTAYTFAAADFGFSDAGDSPANALSAVKITTLPGAGSLTNNGVVVNAGDFITAADIATGMLVFTPVANANGAGYASFSFQVQDDGGTANGGVDLDQSANTMSIDVIAVNEAPAGTDNTVSTLEDTAYTFGTVDFGFSDTADSPADTLLAVRITTVPVAGTLTDNGVAVTAGQFVTLADIGGGKLQFAPAANANGTAYASFTFQVQDDGGVANGGLDLDPTARVMTVDVTAVNDAPVITQNGGAVVTASSSVTIPATQLNVADVDNSPAQLVFTVSSLPSAGSLRLAGATLGMNGTFTQADVTSGTLSYQSGGALVGTDSFVFSVADGAGGTLGPIAFAITTNSPPPPAPSPVVAPPAPPPPVTTPTAPGSGPITPVSPAPPPAPSAPAGESPGSSGGATPGAGSGSTAGGEAALPIDGALPAQVGPTGRMSQASAFAGNDGKGRGADPIKVQSAAPGFAGSTIGGPAVIGAFAQGATMPFAQTETLTISASDPGFKHAPEAVRLEAYRSMLGNRVWVDELNRIREEAGTEVQIQHHKIVVDSTVAVTGAMSVGYVIWLLRGGLLLSTLLSSLPAWHAVDPMPVLARSGRAGDEGEGDDPLEKLFSRAKAAIGLGRDGAEQTTAQPEPAPEDESAHPSGTPAAVIARAPGAHVSVPA